MPRMRWRIPDIELRQYRSIIRELNACGADLDLSLLRNGDPFTLECRDCYARTVQCGSVYVLSVSLLGLAPRTVLTDFELTSPEYDLSTYLMGDPQLARLTNDIYRLLDGTTFHRNEVLNHRVGKDGVLRHGAQLEGVLLAQAFDPVPERYRPGSRIPVVLSIVDQFGDTTEWPIRLIVQPPCVSARPMRVPRRVLEEELVAPDLGAPSRHPNPEGPTGPAPAKESCGTAPQVGSWQAEAPNPARTSTTGGSATGLPRAT